MPQKARYRVDTTEVQGEGSYVVLRRLRVGEMRAVLTQGDVTETVENLDRAAALIGPNVVEWNWSDEEGNPFPLPSQDATVLDRLTMDEVGFLVNTLAGKEAERKN